MELKRGYKQTEVGVIPEDWEVVRLTSVAKLESGHTPSRRFPEYWDGDIPWISLHDTDNLDVPEIQATAQTIGQLGLEHSSARLLPRGTVVFSRTATVGKCTVMGREMATSQDFANYVCGPRVHNHYLRHLFLFMQPDWKRLLAGSTINTIYMPVFETLRVALPTEIPEQRAIAGVLGDVDALLGALDRLIAKKRDLKQAAMQQLLTGQTRLPGFAGKWDTSTVGREFEIQLGKMLDAEGNTGVSKHYLGNKDVQWGRIDVSGLRTVRMTSSDLQRFRLKKGDLLVCEGGEIGRGAIWDEPIQECYYQKALHRLRPTRGYSSYFMLALLRYWTQTAFLADYVTQTSIAHLTREKLAVVPIPAPDHAEQLAIASVLSDMDSELSALEERHHKTRLLKQGMMQELLTGRIRLI